MSSRPAAHSQPFRLLHMDSLPDLPVASIFPLTYLCLHTYTYTLGLLVYNVVLISVALHVYLIICIIWSLRWTSHSILFFTYSDCLSFCGLLSRTVVKLLPPCDTRVSSARRHLLLAIVYLVLMGSTPEPVSHGHASICFDSASASQVFCYELISSTREVNCRDGRTEIVACRVSMTPRSH